jgi:single-stranded-DNA-specific exonuclease
VRRGGHALAAGLTIKPENLDTFRQRMNELARRVLKPEDLQPPLRLDAEVQLSDITPDLVAELDRLKPIGQGNPPVQLCVRGIAHQRPLQRMGAEKQHVKLWVNDGAITQEAVWWNAGNESLPVGKFDLAFVPSRNDFNDRTTVQLKVLDWREA